MALSSGKESKALNLAACSGHPHSLWLVLGPLQQATPSCPGYLHAEVIWLSKGVCRSPELANTPPSWGCGDTVHPLNRMSHFGPV